MTNLLSRIPGLQSLFGKRSSEVLAGESPTGVEQDSQKTIFSDRPIESRAQDAYGYSTSVVPRLARVTLDWPSHDGLVIGLYGQWGIGKSSVLNLFQEHVKESTTDSDNVYVVRFSPWHYDDPGALITSFFGTISEPFDSEKGLDWSEVGDALKKAGTFLAVASQGVQFFGFSVDVQKFGAAARTASGAGELSEMMDRGEKELEELWSEIEKGLSALAKAGGRVVVLTDDADRLDRSEILRLMRLLRRVGDLPAVSIVVAMDEERVRRILAVGDATAPGEKYLEKIVQVGIPIPPPQRTTILSQIAEHIEEVLEASGLETPPELDAEQPYLSERPIHLVSSLIETPRELVRFSNSLRILLMGVEDVDLHPTDAVLIEALHTSFPEVYDLVRKNRHFFTRQDSRLSLVGSSRQEIEAERTERFESILKTASRDGRAPPRSRERARRLIEELFGTQFLRAVPSDTHELAAAQRRIRHPDYFDRYFLHPTEEGELTRSEVRRLVSALSHAVGDQESEEPASLLSEALSPLGDQGADLLFRDLRFELRKLEFQELRPLAAAIVGSEEELGDSEKRRFLIEALVSQRPLGFQRDFDFDSLHDFSNALLIVGTRGLSVTQSLQLLEESRQQKLLQEDGEDEILSIWVERFSDWLESLADPYEVVSPVDLHHLLMRARQFISIIETPAVTEEDLEEIMRQALQHNPNRLPEFLQQHAVISASDIRLVSDGARTPEEAYFGILELLGGEQQLRAAIRRFHEHSTTESDRHGLVAELERLVEQFSRQREESIE